MTTDNLTTSNATFGTRLRTARELMGLEQKDAAAQLRLSEKYIIMMESDHFPNEIPITFARGYLRSYGKLLQIPEWEVKKALEPLQHKETIGNAQTTSKPAITVTSGNYFMQLFTYMIVLTMVGLAGTWWYHHTPSNNNSLAESRPAPATIDPANAINTLPPTAAAATPEQLIFPAQTQPLALQSAATATPLNISPTQKPAPIITEALNTKPTHPHSSSNRGEENETDGDETD